MGEVTQDVTIEMLEKLADGNYKRKNLKAANVKMADNTTVEEKVMSHLADIVTHGFDNIIAFAGFYKVTEFDTPTSGDITETIKLASDDSTFATRLTEFDSPTAGDITVTVTCASLSINNKVVTEFDVPTSGDITETSSEVV